MNKGQFPIVCTGRILMSDPVDDKSFTGCPGCCAFQVLFEVLFMSELASFILSLLGDRDRLCSLSSCNQLLLLRSLVIREDVNIDAAGFQKAGQILRWRD